MNIKNSLSIIHIVLTIVMHHFSFSQKSLVDRIWIEDTYKSALIRFESDSSITVINRENQSFLISEYSIEENYANKIMLKILYNGTHEIAWFSKAKSSDQLLGKWNGILNNKYIEFDIVYSYQSREMVCYLNYRQPNEKRIEFQIISDTELLLNEEYFSFQHNLMNDNLIFQNQKNSFTFFRGSNKYRNSKFMLGLNFFNSDSANFYSGSNSDWRLIGNGETLGLLSITDIGYLAIDKKPFHYDNSIVAPEEIFVSPISINDVFVVFFIPDVGLFLLNNQTQEVLNLDIYSPNLWLAWSPELNFIILHHYYEGDGTLYLYDISYDILQEVDMTHLTIPEKQIFYNLSSLLWQSNDKFSILGTVNCNPYESSDCEDHDIVLDKYYFEITLSDKSIKSEKLKD